MDEIEKEKISVLPSQLLMTTICHPMEYAKVLIQLGYEPLPPRRSTTLFGRPAMILPNVFQYIKFIKASDGFFGCYRGLSARLLGFVASSQLTSKSVDKTWVEDPPSRIPYDSLYTQPDAEEENTDKFFIALIVIFVSGLCYCGYHMWRTHKNYKMNLEKLADENIMRSKEKATRLQEPSVSFLQLSKETEEATTEEKKTNGVTVDIVPAVIVEETNEEKPTIRRGSLRFRDVMEKDRVWETLEEKDETSDNEEENEPVENHDSNKKDDNTSESDTNPSPEPLRKHTSRPSLNTQPPYKLDENGSTEILISKA